LWGFVKYGFGRLDLTNGTEFPRGMVLVWDCLSIGWDMSASDLWILI